MVPDGVHGKNMITGGVHGKNVIPARGLIALDFSPWKNMIPDILLLTTENPVIWANKSHKVIFRVAKRLAQLKLDSSRDHVLPMDSSEDYVLPKDPSFNCANLFAPRNRTWLSEF